MDINIQKEEFSYAYIYVIVSAAGYSCQIAARPLHVGGIDVIISGTEAEDENTETITVYLPRQQLFTVNALKNIMQEIERGGAL